MKKSKTILIPLVVVALLATVLVTFAQEQVTITTYYPAPFGMYANITVTDKLKMNTTGGAYFTGVNPGPGIWFSPASGAAFVDTSEIVSYNRLGSHGLRMIYYATTGGVAAEKVLVGILNIPTGSFRGLTLDGTDQALFSHDLTITHDLYILNYAHLKNFYISKVPASLSDPMDSIYVGVPGFISKMGWTRRGHLVEG